MSRKGQWGCEACAKRDGHAWGEGQFSSPYGWCGLGAHRVKTKLEFIDGAEAGEAVNAAPAPLPEWKPKPAAQLEPASERRSAPVEQRTSASTEPDASQQMELF
jgi:hypothetical protein